MLAARGVRDPGEPADRGRCAPTRAARGGLARVRPHPRSEALAVRRGIVYRDARPDAAAGVHARWAPPRRRVRGRPVDPSRDARVTTRPWMDPRDGATSRSRGEPRTPLLTGMRRTDRSRALAMRRSWLGVRYNAARGKLVDPSPRGRSGGRHSRDRHRAPYSRPGRPRTEHSKAGYGTKYGRLPDSWHRFLHCPRTSPSPDRSRALCLRKAKCSRRMRHTSSARLPSRR